MSQPAISRRTALTTLAGAAGTLALGFPATEVRTMKGNLKQSVCRWCYGNMPLDELCRHAKEIGLVGIDLIGEADFETVNSHGLTVTMVLGLGTISDGWNAPENHERLVQEAERLIPIVAKNGFKNLITFSGNRRGMEDEVGLKNCTVGLKTIMPVAEEHGVTVCMELLNSKRTHPDYMCDRTPWGVALCKEVASERFKLLYDIFHMQIMEGDMCDTIRENIPYLHHFHTGGVPGRREIDDTQEINYPRVCRAILEAGFTGYLAHEFIPAKEPIASLRTAAHLCDV